MEILKFQDMSDEVSLIITEMKLLPPYIMEDKAGVWTGILIQGESRIKTFLAAGLALCLSNLCNTNILDERMVWYKEKKIDFLVCKRF